MNTNKLILSFLLTAVFSDAKDAKAQAGLVEKCITYNVNFEISKAIEVCNRALETEPKNGLAIMNLAQSYKKNIDLQNSAKFYKRYIQLFEKEVGEFDIYIAEAKRSIEMASIYTQEDQKLLKEQISYLIDQGKGSEEAFENVMQSASPELLKSMSKQNRTKYLKEKFNAGVDNRQMNMGEAFPEQMKKYQEIKGKNQKIPLTSAQKKKFDLLEEKIKQLHANDPSLQENQIKTYLDIVLTSNPDQRDRMINMYIAMHDPSSAGKSGIQLSEEAGFKIKRYKLSNKAESSLDELRRQYELFFANPEDVESSMKQVNEIVVLQKPAAQEKYLYDQIVDIKRRLNGN